jgi:predicted RNA-binding Zn-ribbon protein involved in translation (DUF1610 family)
MTLQSHRPNRRKRSFRRSLIYFFRDNMVEVVAGLFLLMALILYVVLSPKLTKIPDSISDWLQLLSQPIGSARKILANLLSGQGLLDALFAFSVALIILLILLRVRYRFAHSRFWNSRNCPRCGEYIHRVHRRPVDRYIAPIFLPHPRRYRCPKCEWEGLRRGGISHPPA